MPERQFPSIEISQTGVSTPLYAEGSNTVEIGDSVNVSFGTEGEPAPALPRRVYRVMDDRLFAVDPGSPPAPPA